MAANAGATGDIGKKGLDIRPDYQAFVEDVYCDLIKRMISKERTLAILYVPKDPGFTTNLNLPS